MNLPSCPKCKHKHIIEFAKDLHSKYLKKVVVRNECLECNCKLIYSIHEKRYKKGVKNEEKFSMINTRPISDSLESDEGGPK